MPEKLSGEARKFVIKAYPMIKCENPDCKKEFCRPTGQWAYKLYYKGKIRTFCCYSCMRVIQKQKEAEEKEVLIQKKTKKRGFIHGKD